jgi:hypothetical protein
LDGHRLLIKLDTTAAPHGVASPSLESAPVLSDTREANTRPLLANGKMATFINNVGNRTLIVAVQEPPRHLSTKMNAKFDLNLAGSISIGPLSS